MRTVTRLSRQVGACRGICNRHCSAGDGNGRCSTAVCRSVRAVLTRRSYDEDALVLARDAGGGGEAMKKETIRRFTGPELWLHWSHAVLYLLCSARARFYSWAESSIAACVPGDSRESAPNRRNRDGRVPGSDAAVEHRRGFVSLLLAHAGPVPAVAMVGCRLAHQGPIQHDHKTREAAACRIASTPDRSCICWWSCSHWQASASPAADDVRARSHWAVDHPPDLFRARGGIPGVAPVPVAGLNPETRKALSVDLHRPYAA